MRRDHSHFARITRIIWIALFLVLCLVPSLGMLIAGETQPSANEILASRPELILKNGKWNKRFFNGVSDYIADRFAFRKQLVNAWSDLNSRFFRTSVEEQVILGTNGWLYYEPTVDDYMGRAMSEDELELAAAYLAALQNEVESRGARFFFTIAPNKNSLYGEHMPSYIPCDHGSSNAEKIKPYLERYGVKYIDLFPVFSEREQTLYYQTDSHWTDRGAALAADTLLDAMGKGTSFFSGAFHPDEPHRGDLYEMLYPTGSVMEEREVFAPGFSFKLANAPNGGNALRIRSECDGQSGTLLCWRDSFGISLYPYLAENFATSVFLRSATYDPEEIDKSGADTVLVELVERNLSQLAAAGLKNTADQRGVNDHA